MCDIGNVHCRSNCRGISEAVPDLNASTLLADLILAIHFAFVAFVVGGLIVIWIGHFLGWQFVHHFGFRLAHVAAMGFVLLEAVMGMVCPLTAWENQLRAGAGTGGVYQESFIQHWLGRILFYDVSEKTFTLIYAAFFALVVLTFWKVPARRRARNVQCPRRAQDRSA